MPFFSVLVPVYNVEQYLTFCLESILMQDFNDYEIILVDDGSTDGSGKLCDEYALKYPDCIKVIHQENCGLLMARRTGIKAAKGQFFMFVDSDDAIEVGTLKKIYAVLENHQYDLLIFHAFTWNGVSKTKFGEPFKQKSGELSEEERHQYYISLLKRKTANSIWSKIVSRSIVDIDRDYAPVKHISTGEDLIQSMPILNNAKNIYYLNENLYLYRTNNTSLTHSFSYQMYNSLRSVNLDVVEYAEVWKNTWNIPDASELAAYNFMCGAWQVMKRLIISNEDISSQKVDLLLHYIHEDQWFQKQFKKSQGLCEDKLGSTVLSLLYQGNFKVLKCTLKLLRTGYRLVKR